MRLVAFHQTALDDYSEWAKTDKKLFERIRHIIIETAKTPFDGIGKPEPLKHELKGYWSRRLTDEHRLVYKVTDEQIIIVSCKISLRVIPLDCWIDNLVNVLNSLRDPVPVRGRDKDSTSNLILRIYE